MKDSVDQVANSLAEAENKVFELQASIVTSNGNSLTNYRILSAESPVSQIS